MHPPSIVKLEPAMPARLEQESQPRPSRPPGPDPVVQAPERYGTHAIKPLPQTTTRLSPPPWLSRHRLRSPIEIPWEWSERIRAPIHQSATASYDGHGWRKEIKMLEVVDNIINARQGEPGLGLHRVIESMVTYAKDRKCSPKKLAELRVYVKAAMNPDYPDPTILDENRQPLKAQELFRRVIFQRVRDEIERDKREPLASMRCSGEAPERWDWPDAELYSQFVGKLHGKTDPISDYLAKEIILDAFDELVRNVRLEALYMVILRVKAFGSRMDSSDLTAFTLDDWLHWLD